MRLVRVVEPQGIDNKLCLQCADAAQVIRCVVFNIRCVENQRVVGNDGNTRIVGRIHRRGYRRTVPGRANDTDHTVSDHVFNLGNLRRCIAFGKLHINVIASFIEILCQILLILQAASKFLGRKCDANGTFGLCGGICVLPRAIRWGSVFRLFRASAKTDDQDKCEKQGNKFFHCEFLL